MYFVEDNAADAHDSQVKDCFCGGVRARNPPLLNTEYVCPESSGGNGGAVFLLDVRGDQGGAQALVAATRQRGGDFPHQRQDAAARLRQH